MRECMILQIGTTYRDALRWSRMPMPEMQYVCKLVTVHLLESFHKHHAFVPQSNFSDLVP